MGTIREAGSSVAKDYRSISFWLESCEDDLTPRPALNGSIEVDVAILGAGFTGLWTAYHLLEREPSLRVAILEAEIAGYGASGRNGGWCYSGFPVSVEKMKREWGIDAARAVQRSMFDAVDDVGRVCELEQIDAHYTQSGTIELGRSPYQMDDIHETYEQYCSLGLEAHYEMLDQHQLADYLRVRGAIGAIRMHSGASIQPARLARGLAQAVERHGATIYEQTRVTEVVPRVAATNGVGGSKPVLRTNRGDVTAETVVLAGEGYLSHLKDYTRTITPMYSYMVVTEPLGPEVWEQIGWKDREVVGGFGLNAGYLNHTADGRIAFGPYAGGYRFNSGVSDDMTSAADIFEHGRYAAQDWFPMLKDVQFTHQWGGVFGVSRDWTPMMVHNRETGIALAKGYGGEGVATTNLSGRVLADLITGRDTENTRLPMTRHQSPQWEIEPLRWLGVTLTRRERDRIQDSLERTGKPPKRTSPLARFLKR